MEKPNYKQYEKMIMKFARQVERKYQGRIEFEELLSQGNLVYMEAIERFDPTKGASFSTHLFSRLRTLYDYAEFFFKAHEPIAEETPETTDSYAHIPISRYFTQAVDSLYLECEIEKLSQEGKFLIREILNDGFVKNTKSYITESLKKAGWHAPVIEETFEELKHLYSSIA